MWAAGWPQDAEAAGVTLGGGAAGLLVVLFVQKCWALFSDKSALNKKIAEQAEVIEARDRMIELLKQQAENDRKTIAVQEAWQSAFTGAYTEAQRTGQFVPIEAIIARAGNNMVGRL